MTGRAPVSAPAYGRLEGTGETRTTQAMCIFVCLCGRVPPVPSRAWRARHRSVPSCLRAFVLIWSRALRLLRIASQPQNDHVARTPVRNTR